MKFDYRTLMFGIFSGSLFILLFILCRYKPAWQVIISFLLHGISAFVLLYIVNTTGWIAGIQVPLNSTTITGVGILGIPGLVLMICLRMVWI